MRAAVWNTSGALDVIDRPVPEPAPGWVRVKVHQVGICGSDLHYLDGQFPSPAGLLPGHEVGATIDSYGEGVAAPLPTGTPVAVEPLTGCERCGFCRVGEYNRCAKRKIFGMTARGGMAEFMTGPADRVYPLPQGVAAGEGALVEPLAVCVRGIRFGGVTLGSRVAVLGTGSIGLVSILAARAAGASEVAFTSRHRAQRELAVAFGGTPLPDGVVDEYDVVVETVGGTAKTLDQSIALARPGATVAILGVFANGVPIDAFAMGQKELRLVNSNCYARADSAGSDFDVALSLFRRHRTDLQSLVTHRFALERVNDAFATAADKSTGSIKVVIEP